VCPPVVTDDIIYVSSTDGSLYALSKTDATPTGPDVTGDGNPAQDLDGDGLYEDVNGDGSFTIVDVQALFANLDSDAVQQNADLFDFNGDGEVNVSDVQTLYSKLQ
jgi:PKD repeat protein